MVDPLDVWKCTDLQPLNLKINKTRLFSFKLCLYTCATCFGMYFRPTTGMSIQKSLVSEIGRETNHKHVLHSEWEILQSCRCTTIIQSCRCTPILQSCRCTPILQSCRCTPILQSCRCTPDLPLYIMRNKNDGANGTNSSHWSLKSLNSQHAPVEVRDTQTAFTYSSITLWLNRVHETRVLYLIVNNYDVTVRCDTSRLHTVCIGKNFCTKIQ